MYGAVTPCGSSRGEQHRPAPGGDFHALHPTLSRQGVVEHPERGPIGTPAQQPLVQPRKFRARSSADRIDPALAVATRSGRLPVRPRTREANYAIRRRRGHFATFEPAGVAAPWAILLVAAHP